MTETENTSLAVWKEGMAIWGILTIVAVLALVDDVRAGDPVLGEAEGLGVGQLQGFLGVLLADAPGAASKAVVEGERVGRGTFHWGPSYWSLLKRQI